MLMAVLSGWKRLLLVSVAPACVYASSVALAKLCPDKKCTDPEYPLLDYDNGECVCMGHPCWNDKTTNSCKNNKAAPYLHYTYASSESAPQCSCSEIPHYDSEYMVRVKCPGKSCDDVMEPVLDLNEKGECICRNHPCNNVDGKIRICKDKDFPIRRYLVNLLGKGSCDCVAPMEAPAKPADVHSEF
mmetsp:Transcript_57042/g.105454  ORF Transcript_57042/g.105454 Transcript_57042/m.105454 type:complete len:187 (-) Transcript_57042:77-637(-)